MPKLFYVKSDNLTSQKSVFPGASKVALTLDVATKRRVIHVKCVSDVFAQEFSWSVS